jgi:hypothetical protein
LESEIFLQRGLDSPCWEKPVGQISQIKPVAAKFEATLLFVLAGYVRLRPAIGLSSTAIN